MENIKAKFHLSGLTKNFRLNLVAVYYDLNNKYLIKPECRDEAYFMFLHNLERNGVVKIDNV